MMPMRKVDGTEDTLAALEEAVGILTETYGTVGAGLAAIGIGSRQTLHRWRVRRRVSSDSVRALAEATGVSVNRLRPDIYGPEPKRRKAASAV